MEVIHLMLADAANRSTSGKLNVLGIFNTINAKTFPAYHPQMYIITELSASPAEYDTEREMNIKIYDSDAQNTVFDWKAKFKVSRPSSGGYATVQNILEVKGIIFPKPDTYQISLLIDNDDKASTKLYVNLIK